MIFTKWRYKSGHTPPDDPELVMADMREGSLEQLTFEECPLQSDLNDDKTPCWCSENTREECARSL